jgi:hypothetical protein
MNKTLKYILLFARCYGKFLFIIVLVALVLIVGTGGFIQLFRRTLPPVGVVTSQNIRTGLVGLDYTAWVDVSVHNSGGPGQIIVWVEVQQGSNSWTKSQSVYLEGGGSTSLTFEFREIGFWTTNPVSYRVWTSL